MATQMFSNALYDLHLTNGHSNTKRKRNIPDDIPMTKETEMKDRIFRKETYGIELSTTEKEFKENNRRKTQ